MSFDTEERKKSTKLLLLLGIFVVILIGGIVSIIPDLSNTITEFNQGLGFKDSAIYAFFITVILLVVLAIASGDGLIGELQFLLTGFIVFFFIIWLFIAWIF